MIVIDKITGKSFRNEEDYKQFLKLVKKEKEENKKIEIKNPLDKILRRKK